MVQLKVRIFSLARKPIARSCDPKGSKVHSRLWAGFALPCAVHHRPSASDKVW